MTKHYDRLAHFERDMHLTRRSYGSWHRLVILLPQNVKGKPIKVLCVLMQLAPMFDVRKCIFGEDYRLAVKHLFRVQGNFQAHTPAFLFLNKIVNAKVARVCTIQLNVHMNIVRNLHFIAYIDRKYTNMYV